MTDHPVPTLRAIGDLDSPLWGDERSRTVWLEACAVAYQVHSFGAALLATALVWAAGPAYANWSIAVMILPGLANVAALRYVRAHGIETPSLRRGFRSPRGWVLLTIVAAWVVGLLRARLGAEASASYAWGLLVGLGVGVLVALALDRRRRRAVTLPDDDVFDDGPAD